MTRATAPKLVEIDADTWAASGGTAGIYGKFPTVRILSHEEWIAIVGDTFDPVVRYDGVDQ